MVSSDYNKFREILNNSRHVVAITGAGISAESGMVIVRRSQFAVCIKLISRLCHQIMSSGYVIRLCHPNIIS